MYGDNQNAYGSLMTKQSPTTDFLQLCDEEADMITIIWDENDCIQHICEEGEKQLSLKTTDYKVKKIKWTNFFDMDVVSAVHEHFSKVDQTLQMDDITLKLNDLHAYNAEVVPFTIKNTRYYIGYFKDPKPMEELRILQEEKEKLHISSWLSAGLVHEIRNPLTSVKGFLQLLQAGITQKEEYYRVMIEEVEKLETITNELLLIAKPDKNEKKKKSVKQLIDDVVFIMDTQTDFRKIDFNFRIEEELYIFCEASRIKQVLINVIKNSAEAMNYEGTIQIETYEENEEIHILIKDEGEGMEAQQIKELHSPFYTTKSNGTGLGLVITNHILQEHDGGFSVEPNEHQGMSLTIHLPSMHTL